MGLFGASIGYTFEFWKENFSKIFLYQLLFLGLYILSLFVVIAGVAFLFFVSYPLSLIPLAILGGAGLILLLIFNYVQLAGYSLLVKRARERKKIEVVEIFKECFKKSHKILAVGLLQSLPMIILGVFTAIVVFVWLFPLIDRTLPVSSFGAPTTGVAILPVLRPTSMAIFPKIPSVLPYLILFGIFLFIVAWYFSLRVWLSLPVFMLEGKGCVESVKESWRITKGKIWSSFFTIIIMGLIVGTIEAIVELPFNAFGIPFIGQIITYLVFAPLSLILPTAYYYAIKMEGRKKQE
ncbi:MAG: glycerophosphoryl diester phosphodiesterase membrane domain-containing protein [Candidatus Aenigmatarchaeota archaeon]